jgi:hypothetical protein
MFYITHVFYVVYTRVLYFLHMCSIWQRIYLDIDPSLGSKYRHSDWFPIMRTSIWCDVVDMGVITRDGVDSILIHVGGSREMVTGEWTWTLGGRPLDYDLWEQDQPDGSGRCLAVFSRRLTDTFGLDDGGCHYSQAYICESYLRYVF